MPDPIRHPVMVQRWTDVVFLHWRVEPAAVQRQLPPGVEVDTFDGSAWVALVPFSMEGLGFPGLAPLPLVGAFPEVNVRTYVRAGGRSGVWFCSLDIDRRLPVAVARSVYRIPYCFGDVVHGRDDRTLTTSVERRWPSSPATTPARSRVVVESGVASDPDDPLDRFLTARWGLVARTRAGSLRWAGVDHPAWPLHHASVVELDDTLVRAAGIDVSGPPDHVRWSPGVPVKIGRPRRIDA